MTTLGVVVVTVVVAVVVVSPPPWAWTPMRGQIRANNPGHCHRHRDPQTNPCCLVPVETARHQRVKGWGGLGISDGYQAGWGGSSQSVVEAVIAPH